LTAAGKACLELAGKAWSPPATPSTVIREQVDDEVDG